MNIKMPRWQWLKSCFVCRMKVAGATNAAHHVENSASVLQHQGLLHISIWNVFQLSIDQDRWKMLSFHFCMKSLNNGKTLSLGSENLWWFSRKPSVYIAIIYPNLIKFTYTNAGLDHWLLWSWRTPSAITRLGLVKSTILCHQFGREALEERWNCKSWESILAADQGFPDIAFLFSSHEPLYECLGGQKLCFEKSRPWFLEISKFFKSKGSSLRPADPRHRKWLGGVYLFGTDGCGPDTSVGSSFWDKMIYIYIY